VCVTYTDDVLHSYGDISADSHTERAGYILFFIAGAYVWGNLLAVSDRVVG